MWRAMFLALGIILCILGAECMVVEKAVLAQSRSETQSDASPVFIVPNPENSPKEIKPPEWAPWSLLSGGIVVILYSYTVPKRNG